MPSSKKRRGSQSQQAKQTQASQRTAEQRREITLRQYRFRRVSGWSMVGLAIAIGVSHWLAHIGLWQFASSGVMDLTAGYPLAVLLGIGGSIVLSKS